MISTEPQSAVGWQRIHDTLQQVLEHAPAERRVWLADLRRTDPRLADHVASLLDADSGAKPFDELLATFAPNSPDVEPVAPAVGPWRPVRVLGAGGMGTVFLAVRADGAFDQQVAIKLLPVGTAAEARARFLAERRILARLRHPNIARLLDGGTTTDGRPYLVLEYVAGKSITEYCDRARLGLAARLRLFLEVCEAVRYAHANLVVHRDLKPSNVLVPDADANAAPTVKLLDFGIAKLLDDVDATAALRTRTHLRVLTPDFAAPEQVRGEPVTTATDVYQLGVLLYELVGGLRPHHVTGLLLRDLERAICGEDPVAPSTALARAPEAAALARARSLSPARLRRDLAGDIDTIVLRALQREPERRYPSVEAFAADVRRHLEGLPVHARRDTFPYRASRFVRRNRRAVAMAAGTTFLLVSASAWAIGSARRAAAERDRAEQATAFIVDLVGDLEPVQLRGDAIAATDLLERGAERARTEFAGQPLLQARLFEALGGVYQLRGHFREAEPLLRNALDLRRAHLDAGDPAVARSQYAYAALLGEVDRHAEAEPYLRAAERALRASGADDALLAAVWIDLGLARRAAGDLAGADAWLARAADLLRAGGAAMAQDAATAVLYLGKVRLERGDPTAAEPLLRDALARRRRLFGETHPAVANAIDGLAEARLAAADPAAAEALFREALAIRERLFPPDHPDRGVGLLNVGIAQYRAGALDSADASLRAALANLRQNYDATHSLVRDALAYLDSVRVARPAQAF